MPPSLTYQPLVPEPAGATPAADAALRALVRALARQAAAEIFAGARAALNEEPTNAPISQADHHP
jgi:hypothetical protein